MDIAKRLKSAVAAAKAMEGKKIDQLEQNKLAAVKCLVGTARQSKKNNQDMIRMPCIRGVSGIIKVILVDKVEVWKEYEEKLLNKENKWRGELNVKKNEVPCEKVSVKAIVETLNLVKAGNVAGPSGVTFELLKVCKYNSVKKLAEVLTNCCNHLHHMFISPDTHRILCCKGRYIHTRIRP